MAAQPPLPPQQSGETAAQYYVRLRKLWWALRGGAATLRDDVLAEGERQGLNRRQIADRLSVKQAWFNRPLPSRDRKRDFDPSLLPPQQPDEDVIDYCARLRELRDLVAAELPHVAARAVADGERRGERRTKIAADLGVSESFLRTLLSRAAADSH